MCLIEKCLLVHAFRVHFAVLWSSLVRLIHKAQSRFLDESSRFYVLEVLFLILCMMHGNIPWVRELWPACYQQPNLMQHDLALSVCSRS